MESIRLPRGVKYKIMDKLILLLKRDGIDMVIPNSPQLLNFIFTTNSIKDLDIINDEALLSELFRIYQYS